MRIHTSRGIIVCLSFRACADAAPKVADFTELLPGVPWTKQLMEDLSYQLRNHGRFEVVLTTIPGFAKIVALLAHCTRKQKKEELRELHVEVFATGA